LICNQDHVRLRSVRRPLTPSQLFIGKRDGSVAKFGFFVGELCNKSLLVSPMPPGSYCSDG
jgi:hypothetical protein